MQQHTYAAELTEEESAFPLATAGTATTATHSAELASSAVAETQEHAITTTAAVADTPLKTLLATHRKQSRRHALLGNAALVLGGGFLILGLFAAFAALGSLLQYHHLPPVAINFSLTAWEVQFRSEGGRLTVGGLTPLLLLIGALLCAWRVKRGRIRLARQLTQHNDTRVIGPLVEALYMHDRVISNMVTPPLVRLLPQLRAEDAHSLNENQRLLLRLYLGRSKRNLLRDSGEDSDALAEAIIASLSIIGDGTELPTMRRLAAGKGCIGANGRVQDAAKAYLEEVKQRSDRERQAQTLLRGAEATRTTPDTLLRPAAQAFHTSPEQLLRSTASDNPPEQ